MQNTGFLLGVLLAALTITSTLSKSLSSDSEDNDKSIVFGNMDHDVFFKTLAPEEKLWLMKLAVMYHDAEISPNPVLRPFPPPDRVIVPYSSVSETNFSNEVPQALVSQFLNGNVPKHWQKEFTKWLKKDYNLTTDHFNLFRETGYFCAEHDTSCPLQNLDNVGGLCCPFG